VQHILVGHHCEWRKANCSFTISCFLREAFAMPLPEYKQLVDEAKREIKEINATELGRMQQSQQNFTLIDVREPDEVAEGAIAGSKPLPRGQLEHKIDTITTDKDQPIVCYCGGGGRSALAAQTLKRMGFKNVMSLAGGYKGWKEAAANAG
jgi:rhodanese-related sulfurtransferase